MGTSTPPSASKLRFVLFVNICRATGTLSITVHQGIYPTIVIVVVALDRSLNATTFCQESFTAAEAQHPDNSAQPADHIDVLRAQSPTGHIRFAQSLETGSDEAVISVSPNGEPATLLKSAC